MKSDTLKKLPVEASPLFSIIIPTYNRGDFIAKTISSVLNQDFADFEVIVVDDGSTDNTEDQIKTIADNRMKYFKKKNEERSIARNYGIEKSSGQYITFLDSDDLLYPNHLSEAYKLINKNKEPEIFHLSYAIKSSDGKTIAEIKSSGNINKKLIYGNSLSCIGVFVRRDVINKFKFNTDRDIIGSEDYELWMRLAARYKIYSSSVITSILIEHQSRSVNKIVREAFIQRIEKLYKYLVEDSEVKKAYAPYLKVIKCHLFLYCALHLIIAGYRYEGCIYYFKALMANPVSFFSWKSLVLIKKLFVGK